MQQRKFEITSLLSDLKKIFNNEQDRTANEAYLKTLEDQKEIFNQLWKNNLSNPISDRRSVLDDFENELYTLLSKISSAKSERIEKEKKLETKEKDTQRKVHRKKGVKKPIEIKAAEIPELAETFSITKASTELDKYKLYIPQQIALSYKDEDIVRGSKIDAYWLNSNNELTRKTLKIEDVLAQTVCKVSKTENEPTQETFPAEPAGQILLYKKSTAYWLDDSGKMVSRSYENNEDILLIKLEAYKALKDAEVETLRLDLQMLSDGKSNAALSEFIINACDADLNEKGFLTKDRINSMNQKAIDDLISVINISKSESIEKKRNKIKKKIDEIKEAIPFESVTDKRRTEILKNDEIIGRDLIETRIEAYQTIIDTLPPNDKEALGKQLTLVKQYNALFYFDTNDPEKIKKVVDDNFATFKQAYEKELQEASTRWRFTSMTDNDKRDLIKGHITHSYDKIIMAKPPLLRPDQNALYITTETINGKDQFTVHYYSEFMAGFKTIALDNLNNLSPLLITKICALTPESKLETKLTLLDEDIRKATARQNVQKEFKDIYDKNVARITELKKNLNELKKRWTTDADLAKKLGLKIKDTRYDSYDTASTELNSANLYNNKLKEQNENIVITKNKGGTFEATNFQYLKSEANKIEKLLDAATSSKTQYENEILALEQKCNEATLKATQKPIQSSAEKLDDIKEIKDSHLKNLDRIKALFERIAADQNEYLSFSLQFPKKDIPYKTYVDSNEFKSLSKQDQDHVTQIREKLLKVSDIDLGVSTKPEDLNKTRTKVEKLYSTIIDSTEEQKKVSKIKELKSVVLTQTISDLESYEIEEPSHGRRTKAKTVTKRAYQAYADDLQNVNNQYKIIIFNHYLDELKKPLAISLEKFKKFKDETTQSISNDPTYNALFVSKNRGGVALGIEIEKLDSTLAEINKIILPEHAEPKPVSLEDINKIKLIVKETLPDLSRKIADLSKIHETIEQEKMLQEISLLFTTAEKSFEVIKSPNDDQKRQLEIGLTPNISAINTSLEEIRTKITTAEKTLSAGNNLTENTIAELKQAKYQINVLQKSITTLADEHRVALGNYEKFIKYKEERIAEATTLIKAASAKAKEIKNSFKFAKSKDLTYPKYFHDKNNDNDFDKELKAIELNLNAINNEIVKVSNEKSMQNIVAIEQSMKISIEIIDKDLERLSTTHHNVSQLKDVESMSSSLNNPKNKKALEVVRSALLEDSENEGYIKFLTSQNVHLKSEMDTIDLAIKNVQDQLGSESKKLNAHKDKVKVISAEEFKKFKDDTQKKISEVTENISALTEKHAKNKKLYDEFIVNKAEKMIEGFDARVAGFIDSSTFANEAERQAYHKIFEERTGGDKLSDVISWINTTKDAINNKIVTARKTINDSKPIEADKVLEIENIANKKNEKLINLNAKFEKLDTIHLNVLQTKATESLSQSLNNQANENALETVSLASKNGNYVSYYKENRNQDFKKTINTIYEGIENVNIQLQQIRTELSNSKEDIISEKFNSLKTTAENAIKNINDEILRLTKNHIETATAYDETKVTQKEMSASIGRVVSAQEQALNEISLSLNDNDYVEFFNFFNSERKMNLEDEIARIRKSITEINEQLTQANTTLNADKVLLKDEFAKLKETENTQRLLQTDLSTLTTNHNKTISEYVSKAKEMKTKIDADAKTLDNLFSTPEAIAPSFLKSFLEINDGKGYKSVKQAINVTLKSINDKISSAIKNIMEKSAPSALSEIIQAHNDLRTLDETINKLTAINHQILQDNEIKSMSISLVSYNLELLKPFLLDEQHIDFLDFLRKEKGIDLKAQIDELDSAIKKIDDQLREASRLNNQRALPPNTFNNQFKNDIQETIDEINTEMVRLLAEVKINEQVFATKTLINNSTTFRNDYHMPEESLTLTLEANFIAKFESRPLFSAENAFVFDEDFRSYEQNRIEYIKRFEEKVVTTLNTRRDDIIRENITLYTDHITNLHANAVQNNEKIQSDFIALNSLELNQDKLNKLLKVSNRSYAKDENGKLRSVTENKVVETENKVVETELGTIGALITNDRNLSTDKKQLTNRGGFPTDRAKSLEIISSDLQIVKERMQDLLAVKTASDIYDQALKEPFLKLMKREILHHYLDTFFGPAPKPLSADEGQEIAKNYILLQKISNEINKIKGDKTILNPVKEIWESQKLTSKKKVEQIQQEILDIYWDLRQKEILLSNPVADVLRKIINSPDLLNIPYQYGVNATRYVSDEAPNIEQIKDIQSHALKSTAFIFGNNSIKFYNDRGAIKSYTTYMTSSGYTFGATDRFNDFNNPEDNLGEKNIARARIVIKNYVEKMKPYVEDLVNLGLAPEVDFKLLQKLISPQQMDKDKKEFPFTCAYQRLMIQLSKSHLNTHRQPIVNALKETMEKIRLSNDNRLSTELDKAKEMLYWINYANQRLRETLATGTKSKILGLFGSRHQTNLGDALEFFSAKLVKEIKEQDKAWKPPVVIIFKQQVGHVLNVVLQNAPLTQLVVEGLDLKAPSKAQAVEEPKQEKEEPLSFLNVLNKPMGEGYPSDSDSDSEKDLNKDKKQKIERRSSFSPNNRNDS